MSETLVRVFGKPTCPDTQRVRAMLDEHQLSYEWLNVEERPELQAEAMELNGGIDKVPTVVLGEQTTLVEPSDEDLATALVETNLLTAAAAQARADRTNQ